MKKLAAFVLFLFLTTGLVLADTPKDADPKPAKKADPAKPKAAKETAKSGSALAAEIEELRQAIQSQQEQLQLLKEELAKRDHQIDEAREAAAAANARAAEASTKAAEAVNSTAEVKSTATGLNSTVSDLKATTEVLKTTVANNEAQEKKNAEEGPTTIHYKGIGITPGGFIAAETVFRNRAASADINTPFTGIPYPGSGLANVTEFNATARQSRLSLLAEGHLASVKLTGYYEADWLGTGVTSNNRQSDSYVMRQRVIFGQAAFESGFSVTAGQQWSLATENRKGIDNRTEVIPLTIDPQYTVGFTWERQFGFRLVKNFGKVALALAVENPQLTFGGRGFPANFFVNAVGQGGGLFNFVDTAGYSVNQTPDFILKAAYDPGFGHYEVFGIVSTFRNRIYPCALSSVANPCSNGATTPSAFGAFNNSKTGGGVGVNMRWPLLAKKLDFGIHALGGDGVGRYSSAQLPDVTAKPDSTLEPIRGGGALGSIEAHPSPKLDVYAYYGTEYAFRTAYTNAAGTAGIGYGSPFFNNVPCSIAALPGAAATGSVPGGTLAPAPTPPGCAGDIRNIWEGTLGFWHKPYQSTKGRFQWGIQYSYLEKVAWSGTTGTGGGNLAGSRAKAVDNMVWTSFRYYLP